MRTARDCLRYLERVGLEPFAVDGQLKLRPKERVTSTAIFWASRHRQGLLEIVRPRHPEVALALEVFAGAEVVDAVEISDGLRCARCCICPACVAQAERSAVTGTTTWRLVPASKLIAKRSQKPAPSPTFECEICFTPHHELRQYAEARAMVGPCSRCGTVDLDG